MAVGELPHMVALQNAKNPFSPLIFTNSAVTDAPVETRNDYLPSRVRERALATGD